MQRPFGLLVLLLAPAAAAAAAAAVAHDQSPDDADDVNDWRRAAAAAAAAVPDDEQAWNDPLDDPRFQPWSMNGIGRASTSTGNSLQPPPPPPPTRQTHDARVPLPLSPANRADASIQGSGGTAAATAARGIPSVDDGQSLPLNKPMFPVEVDNALSDRLRAMPDSQKSQFITAGIAALKENVVGAQIQGTAGNQCIYPRSNWTCPAGFFCMVPSDNDDILAGRDNVSITNRCTGGFACPENTFQPVYCCAGYYCPTPASIQICPKGKYCPIGSSEPSTCSVFAYCPAGTVFPTRVGLVVLVIAVLLAIQLFFAVRAKLVFKRNEKYRSRIKNRSSLLPRPSTDSRYSLIKAAAPAVAAEQAFDARSSVDSKDAATVLNVGPDHNEADHEHVGMVDSETDLLNGILDSGIGTRFQPRETVSKAPLPRPQLDRMSFGIDYKDLGLRLPNGIQVMNDVSGQLRPGRICAVMGPSGAGKSTFFSLLTGKAKRTSGSITINGIVQELSKFKKLVGFVPQEDIMIRELTVSDILMHSALTRLPADWTMQRKKELVLDTIAFLGLDGVMDSPIGSEKERGISGGQRKRVNIGMELVAAPSVLFLDEPTSGLDSATSYEVCCLLQSITRSQDLTVAAVIHSPSTTTFELFDDLLLLGKGGCIIYNGPREEARTYFAALGFELPPAMNPSEFYMDIALCRAPTSATAEYTSAQLFACWKLHTSQRNPLDGFAQSAQPPLRLRRQLSRKSVTGVAPMMSDAATRRDLSPPRKEAEAASSTKPPSRNYVADAFKVIGLWFSDNSTTARLYVADVADETKSWFAGMVYEDNVRVTPNGLRVFLLCLQRAGKQQYRTAQALIAEQFLHLLMGLFITVGIQDKDYLGKLPEKMCSTAPPLLQLGPPCAGASDNMRFSALFICLGALFAGITNGANTFGPEKIVFWRDAAAGMPVIPYFLAKAIADLPRLVIGSLMYMFALTVSLPYRSTFQQIYAIVLCLYFSAYSMGYFLSSVLDSKSVPFASTGFVIMWAMLLGGVVLEPASLVAKSPLYLFIVWIWDVSSPRWAIEAWYIVEAAARPWIELHNGELNFGFKRTNFVPALGYILAIGVSWCLLAFLGLKLVHRSKQK